MMSDNLPVTTANPLSGIDLEKLVTHGDLSVLSPAAKAQHYVYVCNSLGLNPATKPFAYIKLNGKEVLYALRDCTDQLRSLRNVSVKITAREMIGDVFQVTAMATLENGRTDESIGAVPLKGLQGEALANAYMKAETKSKRRVTLSICGLGLLDESEVSSVPGAKFADLQNGIDAASEANAVLLAIALAETIEHVRLLKPRIANLSGPEREDCIKAATERIKDLKRDEVMSEMTGGK